jgi:hypothetical protein
LRAEIIGGQLFRDPATARNCVYLVGSFALSEGAAFRTLSSRDLPKKRPAYKLVLVADLQDFAHDRFWGFFLSLTPDDSPLLVRNLGTQDIYALDWEEAEAGH